MAHSFLPGPDLVGFDRIFNILEAQANRNVPSFPPYNVVREGEHEYRIELAVAGFTEDEIEIVKSGDVLEINSKRNYDVHADEELLHKGIAERNFRRQFTLADTIEVRGADLVNGILFVYLQNVVPEQDRWQTVQIGSGNSRGVFAKAKELLTE
jgi:molecular chaperone IbpA